MIYPNFAYVMPLFLLFAGCSAEERVTTNTVLAHSNCKGISSPIKKVTLSEVAAYRGTQLLTQNDSTAEQQSTQASDPKSEASELPLLIALSRGVQPSRGFELHQAGQALVVNSTSLQIPVHWTEPDRTKSHPLVNTHPCLVVSVPNASWEHIEAIDQHGVSLGRL